MKYVLSTDVCRYFLTSKSPSLIQRIEMVGYEQVGISSITAYDLYLSLSMMDSNAMDKNISTLEQFLNCFQNVEFIAQDSYTCAQILESFKANNVPIGQLDLAVVAQAINRNMILITDEWMSVPLDIELKTAVWT